MTACRHVWPITPELTVRCKLVTPITLLSGEYRAPTGWTYQKGTGDYMVTFDQTYHTPYW